MNTQEERIVTELTGDIERSKMPNERHQAIQRLDTFLAAMERKAKLVGTQPPLPSTGFAQPALGDAA